MCMFDNSEMAEVLTQKDVRARKEHRCYECRRTIAKGEQYRYETYLADGSISNLKTCRHCLRVREWLLRECGGFLCEAMLEDIEEHAQEEGYGVGVKMMAIGMRRRWKRRNGTMWPLPSIPKTSVQEAV